MHIYIDVLISTFKCLSLKVFFLPEEIMSCRMEDGGQSGPNVF